MPQNTIRVNEVRAAQRLPALIDGPAFRLPCVRRWPRVQPRRGTTQPHSMPCWAPACSSPPASTLNDQLQELDESEWART